ncbi:hypothetical protein CPSG_00916 [Coccidioides posadasii str. Silveira]|uniref:Uncharacterized protein n=1 Tax=Coccidioides posadasii (strain RMSCC 757 / Silveira) TaxID=443226 RepID=E9CTS7_COCPS|nr:hypothetical protein CPSG_00916 [Coccidioides posadasii str. Silveira]
MYYSGQQNMKLGLSRPAEICTGPLHVVLAWPRCTTKAVTTIVETQHSQPSAIRFATFHSRLQKSSALLQSNA